jgi:hypothetical protein
MPKKPGVKGLAAEEALRGYFLSTGHFVVRSVPFNYKNYDVTDVDLWLYIKVSSVSRERACVDVKHKRTPQAMERVLWTKGLREVLGLERAIVATTDNRIETRDFGEANGVIVLHGDFLQRVINVFPLTDRITEEELLRVLNAPCVVDSHIEWRRWFRSLKAMLINRLNFDGCNTFLLAVKLLLEEHLATGKSSDIPVRLLYAAISYLLIGLDYASRTVAQLDVDARLDRLTNGFRFGEAGRGRTEEIVEMAQQLLAESGKADLFSPTELRNEFERQVADYPAEIIAEHFAKSESLKHLFDLARRFEAQAYSRAVLQPQDCPSDEKAVVGLLCDFLGVDRREII